MEMRKKEIPLSSEQCVEFTPYACSIFLPPVKIVTDKSCNNESQDNK